MFVYGASYFLSVTIFNYIQLHARCTMNLQHCVFDNDTIELHGMGAGVVPFAYAPNGERMCLLGRERFCPQWKGSCRWSGFEGSRKENESLMETGLREFIEESLGILPGIDLNYLLSKNYWIRIVLRITSERQTERYHSTYVAETTYDESLPARFLQLRLQLESIERLLQEWAYTRPIVLGDDSDVGPVTLLDEVESETSRLLVQRRVPVAVEEGAVLASPWSRLDEHLQEAILEGESAYGVLQWNKLRERLERMLRSHPSLIIRRDAEWNLVQEVRVIKDHLEKDQIRWWSETELRHVIDQRGTLGSDRFRPYFMPVLQTVLSEFEKETEQGAK